MVIIMIKVKTFDENHELDLQDKINDFLKTIKEEDFIDIKFSVGVVSLIDKEQIFCFSALIIYKTQ